MHSERKQARPGQKAAKIYSAAPINADDAHDRAARLVQSADALIDRILSGDSREFLDANRQTGGE